MAVRKRASRRGAALSLIGIGLAGSLLACTGQGATPAESGGEIAGTVKFLGASGSSEEGYKNLIAGFEKKYPKVKVEAEWVPFFQLGSVVRTRYSAGQAPDVVFTVPGSSVLNATKPLAEAGLLKDLSDRPWAKNIPEEAADLVTHDGAIYTWPLDANISVLAVDEAAAEKAGVTRAPETWDEMLKGCRTATEKGFQLMTSPIGGLIGPMSAQYVSAVEPDWYKKDKPFTSSPAWRDFLARFVALDQEGCLGGSPQTVEDAEQSITMMATGKSVSMLMGSQSVPQLLKAVPTANSTWAIPGDTADETALALSLATGLSVSEAAKNPDAAMAFVDFAASEDVSRAFAKDGNAMSPYDIEVGTLPSGLADLQPIADAGRMEPAAVLLFNSPAGVLEGLNPGIQGLWTGTSTVDQVLEQLDKYWDQGATG